jgi:hypothetical protein
MGHLRVFRPDQFRTFMVFGPMIFFFFLKNKVLDLAMTLAEYAKGKTTKIVLHKISAHKLPRKHSWLPQLSTTGTAQ